MRIPIPDRPGAAAEIFTLAAELGVNIASFEVVHSVEGNKGIAVVLVDADEADLFRGGLIARRLPPGSPAARLMSAVHVRAARRGRSTPWSPCRARRASPTAPWCAPHWPTGTSTVRGLPDGDDVAAMLDCLDALGIGIGREHGAAVGTVHVAGGLGQLHGGVTVDARLAGTTSRFVTALAALAAAPVTVDGLPPLRARPMAPLHDALRGARRRR